MVLVIDNYDSFTFNLVQYFRELGGDVEVRRNDAITLLDIEAMRPTHLVISPGPCTPDQAGISQRAIRHFAGRLPILGVCLGHQCIAQVFGARVVRARRVMHGKTSDIHHADRGVFRGMPQPFQATRYHSLVVQPDTLPASLEVTAWARDDAQAEAVIMGLKHREWAIDGVQFHPESILTQAGHRLLQTFLAQ